MLVLVCWLLLLQGRQASAATATTEPCCSSTRRWRRVSPRSRVTRRARPLPKGWPWHQRASTSPPPTSLPPVEIMPTRTLLVQTQDKAPYFEHTHRLFLHVILVFSLLACRVHRACRRCCSVACVRARRRRPGKRGGAQGNGPRGVGPAEPLDPRPAPTLSHGRRGDRYRLRRPPVVRLRLRRSGSRGAHAQTRTTLRGIHMK